MYVPSHLVERERPFDYSGEEAEEFVKKQFTSDILSKKISDQRFMKNT